MESTSRPSRTGCPQPPIFPNDPVFPNSVRYLHVLREKSAPYTRLNQKDKLASELRSEVVPA